MKRSPYLFAAFLMISLFILELKWDASDSEQGYIDYQHRWIKEQKWIKQKKDDFTKRDKKNSKENEGI